MFKNIFDKLKSDPFLLWTPFFWLLFLPQVDVYDATTQQ